MGPYQGEVCSQHLEASSARVESYRVGSARFIYLDLPLGFPSRAHLSSRCWGLFCPWRE